MKGYSVRTVKFQEVKYSASKTGICPVCGKKATRSETFAQTLNPWNTNIYGQPKTTGEIVPELREKAKAWKAEPVYHAKCEE